MRSDPPLSIMTHAIPLLALYSNISCAVLHVGAAACTFVHKSLVVECTRRISLFDEISSSIRYASTL